MKAPGPPQTGSAIAPSLLYRLTSLVERLDFSTWFPHPAPVEVELGSGDGGFLVEWAQRHPERNFVGIERLLCRLRKLDRRARRRGLANLRGLRLEAAYCLEYLVPLGGIQALHIYFPDPWPKRRHRERRLVNERFPLLACRALALGGAVFLRTDNADYFDQVRFAFAAQACFREQSTPPQLLAVTTEFEREFLAQGAVIRRAAYQKVASAPHETAARSGRD